MKNIKFKKIASIATLFFLCTMVNSTAFAKTCTNYQNGTKVDFIKASINGLNSIPSFNPGDYVKGQPIGNSITGTMNVSNVYTECPISYPGVPVYKSGIGIPTEMAVQGMGSKKVFRTSMNGIGVVIHMAGGIASYLPQVGGGNIQGTMYWHVNIPITVTLVKTGDITAPGVLRGPFMYYREYNENGDPMIEFSFSTDIPVTPRVPTCSVANPSQTVELEKVNASEVTPAGIIPFRTKNFSINLNCSGGDTGTATRAFVTLTDANQSNNFSNVLTLQKTSQAPNEKIAEGIGIQIMKADNTILSFGPESSEAGNPNQWFAGQVNQAPGTHEFIIPLKAGYVKTGPIKAGKVRARTIFTMSYQ